MNKPFSRQSFKEMYELTEDLLDLAKQETFSHNKTPLRGAAFYLMYALYFKQPFRPQARIKGRHQTELSFIRSKILYQFLKKIRIFYF